MSKNDDHTIIRVADNDWNNIMETVSLDGSYSDEIREEIWTAIENMEDFSYPLLVVKIANGKATAKMFNNKHTAQNYID